MLLALPLDQIELEPFYAHILFDVVRLANCLGLISSSIEEIKFKLCTVYVHRLLVICSKLKVEKVVSVEHSFGSVVSSGFQKQMFLFHMG